MKRLKSIKAFSGAVFFIFDDETTVQLNSAQPPLVAEGEIVQVCDALRDLIVRARSAEVQVSA